MNFFTRFIRAWQHVRLQQIYDPLADDWTKDDGLWLANVLSHPTGQKLLKRLNNIVIRGAVEATRRTLNPRFHCGVARGMAQLKSSIDRDYIMALTLAGAQSGKSEASDDERDAADLERLLSQS